MTNWRLKKWNKGYKCVPTISILQTMAPPPWNSSISQKLGLLPPNPPPGNFNENRLYFTKSWVNDQSSCSRKEAYRTPSPLIQTLLSVFIITRETVKWERAQHGFMRLIADVLNFEVMNHPVKLHTHTFIHTWRQMRRASPCFEYLLTKTLVTCASEAELKISNAKHKRLFSSDCAHKHLSSFHLLFIHC